MVDALLSKSKAAEEAGITRQAMSYAVKHGLIQHEQVGPYVLIRTSVARAYRSIHPRTGWPKGKRRKESLLASSAN